MRDDLERISVTGKKERSADNTGTVMQGTMRREPEQHPDEGRHNEAMIPYGPDRQGDLPELLRLLWRQKAVIIGTTMLLTALATTVLLSLTQVYSAVAYVMVDPREQHVVDIEAVVAGLPPDAETVQTEMEVLRSRDLAAHVISRLQLDRDPEFNLALADTSDLGIIDQAKKALKDLKSWVFSMAGVTQSGPPAGLSAIVDTYLLHLDVEAVGESRAISITFTSMRPETAAAVANTIAELYIAGQMEAKEEATERANHWLKSQLATLRENTAESRRAVDAYRKESGLLMGDRDVTIPTQEVSRLAEQLVLAQAQRAEAEGNLQQANAALAGSADMAALPQVIDSNLIQSLREQEVTLSANLAQLSAEYGKNYPTLLTVQQQLQEIRGKIAAEMRRIVVGLRNRLNAARAWEDSLEKRLDEVKSRVGDSNQAQAQLQILEGEASANQTLLNEFLQRFKQTGLEGALQEPDARIISRADPPSIPSFPNRKLLFVAILAVSGFIGVVLAFLNELLDEGFRSTEDIEAVMSAPALGLIPALKGWRGMRQRPESYVLKHRGSAFAESLRGLHASLTLRDGRVPRSILITSSVPQEGKSTIALSLGRLLASTDRKVVVVDADLRRPQIHRSASIPQKPGLVEVLDGKLSLRDAIHRDPRSVADLLPAGAGTGDSAALLGGSRMSDIMGALKETYDLVIIDSAPVLAVVDTRLICRLVDKTVFLVRWQRTRRKVALGGLRLIRESGGIAGVLLTQVDVRKHALYGFSDSGQYYGELAKYYSR
jgi:capsular exopolysaccharide synthesis family protein